jgi:hypothetical protein
MLEQTSILAQSPPDVYIVSSANIFLTKLDASGDIREMQLLKIRNLHDVLVFPIFRQLAD